MLGAEAFDRIAARVLARSRAEQTEVVVLGTDSALTRFASSAIHQNVAERNAEVRVRAVVGKRAGVATSNDLSDDTLDRLADRAAEIARHQPEDPDQPDLPGPSELEPVDAYREETASCPPERRARMVGTICRLATEQGLEASGALTTELSEVGVANSHGLRRHELRTRASLLTVVLDDAGSGYAERTSSSVDDLDAEAIGREAVDKAVRSRGAIRVEPGAYTVVLEEYAVGDVLNYLAYMGFGALAYREGTSFLRGRLGQKVVDERISVWDDGHDPRTLPASFDYEGVAKQRVALFERGVAAGVVYDSRTATRDGRASTGHAMPAPSTFGPFPTNLVMAPGDTPKAELARPIERGLWVTRLHYVNVAKSERAALTGLTRDGTFLIENGEVTRPVMNLRFTESVLDAWNALGAISQERLLVEGWGGGTLAPAMRLDRFTFTGVSDV